MKIFGFHLAGGGGDGIVDGLQPFGIEIEMIYVEGTQFGAFAGDEFEMLAECHGDSENVGEDDGRIHAEAAERLHGNFTSGIGIESHGKEAAFFGAESPIFREVASCLTHEPEGFGGGFFARKGLEEGLWRIGCLYHGA